MKNITELDIKDIEGQIFEKRLADCIILTHDNKILLQYRPEGWTNEFGLNLFGGHVEGNETIIEGLLRELKEEVGATLKESDVQFIGAVSETWENKKEFVHLYFWHDKDGRITGCYEAEARHFKDVEEAVHQPKIMDYTVWALRKCKTLGLVK